MTPFLLFFNKIKEIQLVGKENCFPLSLRFDLIRRVRIFWLLLKKPEMYLSSVSNSIPLKICIIRKLLDNLVLFMTCCEWDLVSICPKNGILRYVNGRKSADKLVSIKHNHWKIEACLWSLLWNYITRGRCYNFKKKFSFSANLNTGHKFNTFPSISHLFYKNVMNDIGEDICAIV